MFDKKDSLSFSIPPISPTYHSAGFYDDNFFNDIILSAKQRIVICCKRNTRPFKQGNIDELIDKAANGVNIQILSFSPTMDDALLEEIRKSVPHPPKDIEELRNTQKNHAKIYQDRKSKMEESFKRNLNYFETSEIIWFNFVLVDNRFYWGIVNYKKTDEDHSVYKNRPYIEYPLTDPFAKK